MHGGTAVWCFSSTSKSWFILSYKLCKSHDSLVGHVMMYCSIMACRWWLSYHVFSHQHLPYQRLIKIPLEWFQGGADWVSHVRKKLDSVLVLQKEDFGKLSPNHMRYVSLSWKWSENHEIFFWCVFWPAFSLYSFFFTGIRGPVISFSPLGLGLVYSIAISSVFQIVALTLITA